MSKLMIGLDIGGTKCAVILARVHNGVQLLDRICFQTEAQRGPDDVLSRLFDGIHSLLEKNKLTPSQLTAIGVSCGGPLDCRRGLILSPPHLPGWDNIPLGNILTKEFGVPAFIQNDANACALVEWKLGAGRGTQNMVFLTMGTGFGAGIIAENRLIEGKTGFAGEVGHIRLEKDGPVLFGKSGSVEVYCSGAGLAGIAQEYTTQRIAEGMPPAWCADGIKPEDCNAKNISQYAEDGDADGLRIYEIVGERLGETLAVILDLLNPERIVIGSIFTRSEQLLRPAMERVLKAEALPGNYNDCTVVGAETGEKLGDYASIMAACYALDIDVQPAHIGKEATAHYERLFARYPEMDALRDSILSAFFSMKRAFSQDKKLLVCGNGGSAADAEHIVGELMKGFLRPRTPEPAVNPKLQRALPAIALTQHSSLSTAFSNDVDPSLVFAQQVYGYGRRGDVLLCLSTSGNAQNCVQAAQTAREIGMDVISMTGQCGGELAKLSDIVILAPSSCTPDVQELHLPIYHTLCAMLEAEFFI